MSGITVAILYFGIVRSLDHTLPSIEENVRAPARALLPSDTPLKQFGHFFRLTQIDNPRSGEVGQLNPDAALELGCDWLEQEPPEDCLPTYDLERLKAYGDAWDDGFRSLHNLVHQLHSLDRVTQAALDADVDVATFCRPDLRYIDSLERPLRAALRAGSSGVWLPQWQSFGGYNDRFAICRGRDAIAAYGQRVRQMHAYCTHENAPLHSEELLKFALQGAGLPVSEIKTRAARVRMDGSVPGIDMFPSRAKRGAKAVTTRLGVTEHLKTLRKVFRK